MQTKIELQPRREQHLARWEELGADLELAKLPYKIETDRLGRILMSPPPFFDHVRHIARIIELLHGHLPGGKVLPETPVVTSDGVKVTDAAWISAGYAAELEGQHPALGTGTRDLRRGTLPSNTAEEMAEKCALYFEAGAQEVWLCGLDGKIAFYTPEPSAQSAIFSEFPSQI
jgi:hypothetical protein